MNRCEFSHWSLTGLSLLFQASTEESQTQLGERRELNHTERERKEKEKWQELSAGREKEREEERERDGEREGLGEDFERTPSGRVRRRSAQVAVFHLQEIAEDELTKDWGTKRRIKDDLVPDSKRVRHTQVHTHTHPHTLNMWPLSSSPS